MKKLTFLAALFFQLFNINSQDLYRTDTISTIELTFFDPAWDDSLDYYHSNGLDNRMLANCIINGQSFDSVGVKYKGNSSFNVNNVKNPLNIKLDYIKNQDYDGYSTLKLSNGWKDPSFVREALAYEIARNYTTASLTGFANVFINGTLMGLYTNVESVNDQFTRKHFASEDHPLMKGELIQGPPPSFCAQTPPRVWAYEGTDSSCYQRYYEIQSDFGWTAVRNFCDTFNNYQNSMEKVLYVDRHLWTIAFDNLLVSLDAPINIPHNFYIYKDLTGHFNHLLWDLNLAFGSFTRLLVNGSQVQLSGTQLQQLDIFLNSTNPSYPMTGNVLNNARYRKMYIAHMRTIHDEYFTSGLYLTRAQDLQSVIDGSVQNDPNKFYTYSEFQSNVNSTIQNVIGITELVNGRMSYLASLPDFQYVQPVVSSLTNTPSIITQNTTVTISATITNANYACLGYRNSPLDKFIKIEMFDDGLHGDGTSGDNVYGASFPSGTSSIQYYIYAENNDAGVFSPARAEYEFHTLEIQKDVVLNEIMASNSTTETDPDGQFEDWIELYNNSSSSIQLSGYYLSDDVSDLTQWEFPAGTVIPPNGFLIIWADKDTTQAGIHCNFKISASGESVFLVNNQHQIIDEITFGTQQTDLTYGRYPNGTGSWTTLNPTFNALNSNPVSVEENLSVQFTVYPNPAKSTVNIEFGDPEEHKFMIINSLGVLITSGSGSGVKTIDVSGLPKGIYFIRSEEYTKKMVIN